MCSVCGCGHDEVRFEGAGAQEHRARQTHGHGPHQEHQGRAEGTRLIRLEHDILAKNDRIAAHNRLHFAEARVLALNLVSSPGSGKTKLLVRTLEHLKDHLPLAVIEGDQETSIDAERIRETSVPALQVNTGKGCHLDADMIHRALHRLNLPLGGVLFIENVGNMVCPAGFNLGESHKVCVISTTEGEDKPLKYPDIVAASNLLVISKVDLLPYLDFDLSRLIAAARRVNPAITILALSSKTGAGMGAWYDWIAARVVPAQAAE